jgi:hypothetical protein
MKETLEKVDLLIQGLVELGLDMAIPVGIAMHEHNITKCWSRLDHVFVTEHTLEAVNQCEAIPEEQGVNTDHILIVTKMDWEMALALAKETSNFRDINWREFRASWK